MTPRPVRRSERASRHPHVESQQQAVAVIKIELAPHSPNVVFNDLPKCTQR